MPSALVPAWWVTRWLARSVAMLAMTAFTALALALGAGTAAVPAAAALPASGPAPVVQPARVTVAADVTAGLDTEWTGGGTDWHAAPPEPAGDERADRDDDAAVADVSSAAPASVTTAGPVGERAPPRR